MLSRNSFWRNHAAEYVNHSVKVLVPEKSYNKEVRGINNVIYVPDFYLPRSGVVYETKMSFALEREDVKSKHNAADLYCRETGLAFVILTEKELGYAWSGIQDVITNDKMFVS